MTGLRAYLVTAAILAAVLPACTKGTRQRGDTPHPDWPCGIVQPREVDVPAVYSAMDVRDVGTPYTCGSWQNTAAWGVETLSYHEFLNACRGQNVLDLQGYCIANRGSVRAIAADGVTSTFYGEFSQAPTPYVCRGGTLARAAYDGSRDPRLWLEIKTFETLESPTMVPLPWALLGASVIDAPENPTVVGELFENGQSGKRWAIYSAANPLAEPSGQVLLPGTSGASVYASRNQLFVVDNRDDHLAFARTCQDASISDRAWIRVTNPPDDPQDPARPYITSFDMAFDDSRYVFAYFDDTDRDPYQQGHILIAIADLAGNLHAPPSRIVTYGKIGGPRVAADGSGNYIVAWTDASTIMTADRFHVVRFDSDGNPLGCDLEIKPPPTDFGIGTDRIVLDAPLIAHNGSEWVANFCTMSTQLGPWGPIHGALWRFRFTD